MIKALIVYDSYFNNTEQIARAIGDGLREEADVEICRVGDAKPEQLAGFDLLIVGSPTRAFRPTPATTAFLNKIPKNSLRAVKVAAFDTGLAIDDIGSPILRFFVRIFGYAAKPISGKLKGKGGKVVIPPEGFFVTGTKGPLKEGELQRATDWGRRIAEIGGN